MSEGGLEKSLTTLRGQEGYKEWARLMKGYLMMTDGWGVVSGTEQSPTDPKELKEWQRKDTRAQGILQFKCTPEVAKCFEGKTSSKEIWDSLKATYEKSDNGYSFSRFEHLLNYPRFDESKSIVDQVQTFIGLMEELTSTGTNTLADHIKVYWLFSKMPEAYRPAISTILHTTPEAELKLDKIQPKLKLEDSLRGTSIGQANKISKPKPRPGPPCIHCGKDNHDSSNCYKKFPEKNPRNKKKGKGKESGKGGNESGKGNSNGHNHAHTVSAIVPVANLSNELSVSFYNAANAVEGYVETIWLMDSGASCHVTGILQDFVRYRPYKDPVYFNTAQGGNEGQIACLGEGTIEGYTQVDGRRVNITLDNVSYIPAARETRLFSTGTIERNGSFIYQGDGNMSIYNSRPKGRVASGSTVEICGHRVIEAPYVPHLNLYVLPLVIRKGNTGVLDATSHATLDYDIAHGRWGHPGKEALRRLPDATTGIDGIGPPTDKPCDGCAKGKMSRRPFPPSEKRATVVLALVHMDVAGPLGTSIGGYNYFCVFVDDYSGFAAVYALKRKSDQEEAFRQFKAWAETQMEYKIKKVRSDRGGEYLSETFQTMLREYGIEHDKTMPGTPQQNGRAERFIRTISEKALCMLHFAGLSHGFWKLALDAAVHTYNRQPMKRLKWECPITLWTGKKPDVSYFRVFGCKAYVHVQRDKRHGKLDQKAVERTFVGYESGSKGYRLWNPSTRQIEVSRDVVFDETIFPARADTGTRRATPDDSPFPDLDSPEEQPDGPNGDVDLPVPAHLDNDDADDAPPPDPAPAPQPAPQPDPAPAPPPPRHRRQKPPPEAEDPPPVRRSNRPNKGVPPSRYTQDNTYGDEPPAQVDARTDADGHQREAEAILSVINYSRYKSGIPEHHKDAMASPERDHWVAAERMEYESLLANKTWILVPRPKDRSIVTCRWVYDLKSDGRFKARLVARGFTQVYGKDYHETFSPVARFESIRYLFAHAALEDWDIDAMDVKTAFLNGDLDEEVYMEQPEGWVVKGKEDHVCLLKKAIYGLKQASRQWNIKIHDSLIQQGFVRTYSDAGVYVYRRQGGDSDPDHVTIIVLYVDDLLLMGNRRDRIDKVKKALGKQYKMTDLGPVERFLGLRIRRDRPSRILDIDQEEFVEAVLEHHQMASCKPARTPLPAGAQLVAAQAEAPAKLRLRFQSLMGSLLYACLGTRPDIAYAINRLGKYSANPSEDHLNKLFYVLRYLRGTAHYRLRYDGASNAGLAAFSDSDWAEDRDDRHSQTGFIFTMANGAISWASRRQPTVSLSSTEAEYKAASDTSRQMEWLRTFGDELGDDMSASTPMYVDNHGAIFLSENPAVDRRTKHVEVHYHFVREYRASGSMEIYYVPSEENLADALTKNVSFSVLEYFVAHSGLVTSAS